MKLLIVPSEYITKLHNRNLDRFFGIVSNLKRFNFTKAYNVYKAHYLSTEHYYYGDIVSVLGYENVAIVGSYYKEYLTTSLDPYILYPSLFNTPKTRSISKSAALSELYQYDAIIFGGRCGEFGEILKKEALRKSKYIVQLDYQDDKEIYKSRSEMLLTRGMKYGCDYHMYFKHDIPLGMKSNRVLPIAPMPIRFENYPLIKRNWNEKSTNVFYSGRISHGARNDRGQLIKKISELIPKSEIKFTNSHEVDTIFNYVNSLSRSKIALSPSGKVWDSTRHCETAVYNCAPLIPQPDCETVGNLIRDDDNALAYKIKFLKHTGEFSIIDIDKLIDRIKDCIEDDSKLFSIAKNWTLEIQKNHTTYSRAAYIVDTIKKSMNSGAAQ
jgi:hypothetical protein